MTDQLMPVYDRRAWQTYRRDAKCDCTAPDPVDCASACQPKPTRQCPCHYLSVVPTAEELAAARATPDNPVASGDAADKYRPVVGLARGGRYDENQLKAAMEPDFPADPAPATPDDGLRERVAAALRTTPATDTTHKSGEEKWDHHPRPGEEGHRYTYTCALCRNDVDALTDAVLAALDTQEPTP